MNPYPYSKIKKEDLSSVELFYLEKAGFESIYSPTENIPVIQVDNFPELGKFTAQRFIEWVIDNPGGVISLPTGKTPEHFIKWAVHYLDNWKDEKVKEELSNVGIDVNKNPDMRSLHFVQIDEFYPIDSFQHNSFNYYIQKYYFKNFDLDPAKGLLINVNEIPTAEKLPLDHIFPGKIVDLSLRTRMPSNRQERLQKRTIELVDEFCTNYERKIRDLGGIGFFLGGIGPDGHIGFNIQGSDHFSSTRLIETNYQTQAAASTDLGGIEIARNRLVITIGLNTIVHNKDATAIIIAAGEAKSNIVRDSIENTFTNTYPATALQQLKNSRFYLTDGAAFRLKERRFQKILKEEPLTKVSIHREIINIAVNKNKQLNELDKSDYESDKFGNLILERRKSTPEQLNEEVRRTISSKFEKGLESLEDETILHTGPHHDDIMLGYLPYIVHLVRESSNSHHFATMTSGFTAVTNKYMLETMRIVDDHLSNADFRERFKSTYFDPGYGAGKNRDVNLYLDGIAFRSRSLKNEAIARRMVRNLIEIYEEDNLKYLEDRVDELINYFKTQYPGKKDVPHVQKLKGMIREFEEEIVWAHLGFNTRSISHLRLGFYQGNIFTENPEVNRDVRPILELLREVKPTIVTVALDPEGSGPDTHYKVLQATTEALKLYEKEADISDLRVWGYRNVWYRFHPVEANIYVPVSLNSLAILNNMFHYSYGSQRDASFPSYELDGPFSRLTQHILVDQYQTIRLCLGKDYFLKHDIPRVRAAHGMVFLKELSLDEFYKHSMDLRKLTESK